MKKTIGVCIPTYKRGRQLHYLLNNLSNQNCSESFKFEIVVVDNDKNMSAKQILDNIDMDIPVHYYLENKKGVANVRNKCIQVAQLIEFDYIAFIDDDEIPSNEWLANLYGSSIKYKADVVFGPVVATYNNKIPAWIIEGGFFDRNRYMTGQNIDYSGAGNVLINLKILKDSDILFDTLFDKSGGEDTDFFMTLNKHRANMIWCDEAIVYEEVAPERAGEAWLIHRAYCGGSNFALCEKKHSRSKVKRVVRVLKGLMHFVIGLIKIALSFNSINKRVKAKMKMNLGLGQVIGSLGINIGKQY